jgi:NitT/TauT family transport system substrate-binding protein
MLLVAACDRTPATAVARPPLKIGAYYWPGMFWIDIANHEGWFEEAGVDVQVVDTNADYFGSFDAVIHGELDMQCFTLFDLMKANAKGADLVAVLAGDTSSGAEKIVGGAGIEHLKDLSGKRISLSKGTYLEYIFVQAARRAGLDPDRVQIVDAVGENPGEALEKNAADAIATWEPFASQALARHHGHVLFDTSQIPGLDSTVYGLRRTTVDSRRDDVQKLLAVWRRATHFIQTDPDAAFAIIAAVNRKTLEQVRAFEQLDNVFDERDNKLAFSFASGFDSLHGAARQINDFMLDRGITKAALDSEYFLDASFVKALDAQ